MSPRKPQSTLSGLMKWEGPGPAFWCGQCYAVCHPDARGAFDSDGDILFFGEQEGRDTYDVIEWVAVQPWCSGKVNMAGTSSVRRYDSHLILPILKGGAK